MSFGHENSVVVRVPLDQIAATGSHNVYPPRGGTYTLQSAWYDDAVGITNGTPGSNYYALNLHQISAADHATVMDDGTGLSWSNASHTAYTPEEIPLSSVPATLALASGEGVEIIATKAGSASDLPLGAQVTLTFVRGEGAGQA